MPRFPGFIGSSYQAQSPIADSERTVNFYVERLQSEGAKNALALYPTPGFTPATVGIPDVGSRGATVANGRCFFVIATGLYEVNADGTWAKRNPALPLAQDSNLATFAYNGPAGHLLISSGGNAYCFVLATNTLTQVLTAEATMVAFSAGRFLAFNITNGHVRISNLNDGTVWDPTLFLIRSLFPDPWQAMFVDSQSLIWLVGTDTYEVWYVTNDPTQPYAPLSGLVGNYGIAASFAFSLPGNQIFWLARNPQGAGSIITPQGGGRSVSNYALDSAIARYQRTATITDAETLTYQDQGHTFAIWNFPSAPMSHAFDVDQPSWCDRGKWNPNQGRYDLWAPRVHCYAFGKHLVGDRTTGTIAVMDATSGTELDGLAIRRLRITPGLTREHQRVPIDVLELLMDTGLGTATGREENVNPQALLTVSHDGGRTYGNERRCGYGRIGEYRKRVYWTRLGAPPDGVFQTVFASSVPPRILDAYINNFEQAA